MRLIGRMLLGLLTLVLLLLAFLFIASEVMLRRSYDAPAVSVTVPTDAVSLARGRHLITNVCACADCHGANLGGGTVFDQQPLGRAIAPNITRGVGGTRMNDADMARLIRYGVKANGRSIMIMPSINYAHLSDADLGAIIGYIRSVPPVDSVRKQSGLGPLGRALFIANKLPVLAAPQVDRRAVGGASPAEGVTVDYGRYLGHIAGCTDCHRPSLAGGPVPAGDPTWPPAPNITTKGVIQDWGIVDFTDMMRTGRDKNGHIVHPAMPTRAYRGMTDDELAAVWAFLQAAPPVDPATQPTASAR